jgi:prepilin-type N-terminal cleavage/methylation domain-containing protein
MSLRARRGSEGGATLIELLIVVALIGILSNIAVPIYSRVRLQAQVDSILGAYRTVQTTATSYYLRTGEWPPEVAAGEVPPELVDALGGQIDWQEPFLFDWDNLIGPDGKSTQPESGVRVGFSVRTRDPILLQLIQDTGIGPLAQTWGWGTTFVIEGVLSPSDAPTVGGGDTPPVDSGSTGGNNGNGNNGNNGNGNNGNGNGNNGNNGRGRSP